MFEKFLFRCISVFVYLGALILFLSFVGSIIGDEFSYVASVIFLVISFVLVYLGRKLWNIPKPKNDILSSDNESEYKEVCITTTTEVPIEVLKEMKKYYSVVQLQSDLRILQESVELIKSTKNIDTFISRVDLAQRTALTIEQAIMAGICVKEKFITSKEILKLKTILLPNLLNESYFKMKQDASKLKTEKGKIGRYQSFLELLQENEYDLDLSENYEDIVEAIKRDLKQSTLTNNL